MQKQIDRIEGYSLYSEDELLALSGLQHLLFCERQWALIHLEQQWEENRLTSEGRLLHAKTDSGKTEQRGGIRTVRSLHLRSFRLGLSGVADVVEFPLNGDPPYPVEYKRGRNKAEDVDRVQLCAQALCLEEMLGVEIPVGALFYGEPRRRSEVELDSGLRRKTEELARRMHEIFSSRRMPAPEFLPHCQNCSLIHICQPETLTRRESASSFFRRAVRRRMEESE